jgi:hypothetical protein
MEADAEYRGIGVHNHHYHSPNWLSTTLIYLDEDPTGYKGTSLVELATNPDGPWIDQAADIFAETGMWGHYNRWRDDKFKMHRNCPTARIRWCRSLIPRSVIIAVRRLTVRETAAAAP